MTEPPIGSRFSQVYLREPSLLHDSPRLRHRLGVLYGNFDDRVSFGNIMESELGVALGPTGYSHNWPPLVAKLDLRDVLDSITIRWRCIYDPYEERRARAQSVFLGQARRIFDEEQARYRIDDKGGVHFNVDAEFESIRIATIAGLGRQRYAAVRASFDDAYAALDRSPIDGKAAVRSAFFSVEGLFRLMFQDAHQLSGSEVQKHLKPRVDEIYGEHRPAIYLAQKQVAAFVDWIDGAHFYRHEPGTEEPAQPPLDLAIHLVAQAGAHLRWLVSFDRP